MPSIVRKGDKNLPHCSGHEMAEGSPSWFVDGKPACRKGDATTVHIAPPLTPQCTPHSAHVDPPNRGWHVDGKLMVALGDPNAGCSPTGEGSPGWFLS